MDAKKFGMFLANIRKEQKLTQGELAEKLNVTDKAVSRWERGVGLPDINMLEPISNALGISYAEIIQSERIGQDIEESKQEYVLSENEEIVFSKAYRNEQIRIMICYFAIFLFVEGLFIAGQVLSLLVVSRAIMMYMLPIMGLAMVIHAICRKREKLSYKLLLVTGLIIFIPLTLLFIYDYIVFGLGINLFAYNV